jgi:hypothetical protein
MESDNMAVDDLINNMKADFKSKYNYLTDDQVEDLYKTSLNLYLSLSFPLDRSIVSMPEEYARDISIVRMIMTETLERDGFSSATAYSENGMSFTFDNAHISKQILSLITPKSKVVSKNGS